MKNMTYRELREKLNKLQDDQLDMDVIVRVAREDEFFGVKKEDEFFSVKKFKITRFDDVLDKRHPYIEF